MDILKSLRQVERQYKDRFTSFGEVVISDMARDAADEIERLQQKVEKLERARNEAIADLRHSDACDVCAHKDSNPNCDCECDTCVEGCYCAECLDASKWQWRGPVATEEG